MLVVDDSPMIRRIAKKILEELNFKTCEAEDGQKALVAVSDSMPDAILLDWNMPVMDGLAFLVHLRQCRMARRRKSCSAPPKAT